ncbi:MAG: hypothetical protein R3232_04385 [Clostridia bacterium]|nr:hypothetical protein [Clostridia bacterium]
MAFQIIHAFEKFIDRFDTDENFSFKDKVIHGLNELLGMNIDGIVVNIYQEDGYLENGDNWTNFEIALKEAVRMGFRIWLYDENGYPSGGAGGIVLRDRPELEAKGIKFHEGRYFISNIYEGSHAERNFRGKRRYINLLESEAVRSFAKSTYYKYKEMLPDDIFRHVEAVFTDEPSLMTVVLRKLDDLNVYPGRVIPVYDEIDADVPITASIPFSEELNEEFKTKYAAGLLESASGIFEYSEDASEIKCRFWEAVALTYENSYGKVLSGACDDIGAGLTGHVLFEESPILNVAFHSNPFRILKHFHLPGIDLLSNVQENISIFAHKMVHSCAWIKGLDGIMTETSDFNETRLEKKGPTGYKKIISALYKQYALGVREFSFYYDFNIRKNEYGLIARTIKNLYEYGKGLKHKPDCAVYCAYETIWAGFYPSTEQALSLYSKQPGFVREFEDSLLSLCDEFLYNNIQYVLMDESSIDDMIRIGVTQVVLPDCRVINKRLVELFEEGRIKLFGLTPEYTYYEGKLERTTLQVLPIEELTKAKPGFSYEKGLLVTAYENDSYFCFNPTDKPIEAIAGKEYTAYDPMANELIYLGLGNKLLVNPDSAVMIRRGEDNDTK